MHNSKYCCIFVAEMITHLLNKTFYSMKKFYYLILAALVMAACETSPSGGGGGGGGGSTSSIDGIPSDERMQTLLSTFRVFRLLLQPRVTTS